MSTYPERAKTRNARRDERVSVLVEEVDGVDAVRISGGDRR
jgi:hypothetical protein